MSIFSAVVDKKSGVGGHRHDTSSGDGHCGGTSGGDGGTTSGGDGCGTWSGGAVADISGNDADELVVAGACGTRAGCCVGGDGGIFGSAGVCNYWWLHQWKLQLLKLLLICYIYVCFCLLLLVKCHHWNVSFFPQNHTPTLE